MSAMPGGQPGMAFDAAAALLARGFAEGADRMAKM